MKRLAALLAFLPMLAYPSPLILSYPSATTVSGCGLVYTTDRQYQWPCVIFSGGFDP